ncbi:hypothetical protein pb186bvf_000579 [Paramecium bursaria]
MNYSFLTSLIVQGHSDTVGNLFLGGVDSLNDIKNLKIGAVATVIWGSDIKFSSQIKHIIFNVDDDPKFPIQRYFDRAYDFINEQLMVTNVLVHCQAGISRSVSIVTAYLIRHQKRNNDDCLEYVKQKRDVACPNYGFLIQLKDYSNQILLNS